MTDLSKLDVSLTKHGAHKIAALLWHYDDPEEALVHLGDNPLGIDIELAQARKNLSVPRGGKVPDVWRRAKASSKEALDALVLVAIIFSHHQIIRALIESDDRGPFTGTIRRGTVIDGKAFTNLAHIIEELGYSTAHSPEHLRFNFYRLFQISGLGPLVSEVLSLKLASAGWKRKNALPEELESLGLHAALSVPAAQFLEWLANGQMATTVLPGELEDSEFFAGATDAPTSPSFVFKSGHSEKKTGTVGVKAPGAPISATLLHNQIENELYAQLVEEHGKALVGTENKTGQRTSIDVVVKTKTSHIFYEIKTASSVKACIRQALPQLLEYAYWHGQDNRAEMLVVVGPHAITKEADVYLTFLRDKFGLPVSYVQHVAKRKP